MPLVAAALLLFAGGCRNPFSPAEPQRPSVANVSPNYNSPANVLNTLADAIADKGTTNGSSAYAEAFGATFEATVEPAIASIFAPRFGGTLPVWRAENEGRFYSQFVTLFAGSDFLLTFSTDVQLPADEDDPSDNVVTFYRYYKIETLDAIGTIDMVICQGDAEITMVETDNRWAIVRWVDHYDRAVGANPGDDRLSWGSRRYEAY